MIRFSAGAKKLKWICFLVRKGKGMFCLQKLHRLILSWALNMKIHSKRLNMKINSKRYIYTIKYNKNEWNSGFILYDSFNGGVSFAVFSHFEH